MPCQWIHFDLVPSRQDTLPWGRWIGNYTNSLSARPPTIPTFAAQTRTTHCRIDSTQKAKCIANESPWTSIRVESLWICCSLRWHRFRPNPVWWADSLLPTKTQQSQMQYSVQSTFLDRQSPGTVLNLEKFCSRVQLTSWFVCYFSIFQLLCSPSASKHSAYISWHLSQQLSSSTLTTFNHTTHGRLQKSFFIVYSAINLESKWFYCCQYRAYASSRHLCIF